MARNYPDAQIVFSGGSGSLSPSKETEASWAIKLFASLGLSPDRITLESKSRNTYENAIRTKEIINPNQGERWILITSAMHMPRAVAVFEKAGFQAIPYPVDYRTPPEGWKLWMPLEQSLPIFSHGIREWLGLGYYYLMGFTDTFFPTTSSNSSNKAPNT